MGRLLLTLSLLLVVTGAAAGGSTAQTGPTVSIESQEATVRSPVDVPVEISDFGDIGAISLIITYDPEVLSLPEGMSTDGLISGAPRDDFTANVPEPGEIRISWFDAGGTNPITDGTQVLLQLTFSDYKGGGSSIAFDAKSEITDPQADPYDASYQDGEVENAASQIDVSVRRQFERATDPSNYELVALPGRSNVAFGETVTGRPGINWRAFRELGASGEDGGANLRECISDVPCTFQAGLGFWVISQNDWSFQGTVPEVLGGSSPPSIPLQEGWNIISNPLQTDLVWSDVQAANGLSEALWRWADSGTWEEVTALSSAMEGEAYYLFNKAGLDSLDLPTGGTSADARTFSTTGYHQAPSEDARDGPYSSIPSWSRRGRSSEVSRDVSTSERHLPRPDTTPTRRTIEIHAEVDGKRVASVTVGTDPSLEETETYRAPPGYFSEATLHALGDGGNPTFARQILPTDDLTRGFSLLLTGPPGSNVRLVATGLADWETRRPVLIERKTEAVHDLQAKSPVVIPLSEAEGEALLLLRVERE